MKYRVETFSLLGTCQFPGGILRYFALIFGRRFGLNGLAAGHALHWTLREADGRLVQGRYSADAAWLDGCAELEGWRGERGEPFLQKTLVSSLKAHRPPLPLVLCPAPVITEPLGFSWDGVDLEFDGATGRLRVNDADGAESLDLLFSRSQKKIFHQGSLSLLEGQGTTMVWPDVRLRGADTSVSGNAWIEHQAGEAGPEIQQAAWSRLYVRFDNGSRALLFTEAKQLSSRLIILNVDGERVLELDGLLTESGHWQSLSSWVRHPVACHFATADKEVELAFTATFGNQEMPLAEMQRANWLGAGRASLLRSGQVSLGQAWALFGGYGATQDFKNQREWVSAATRESIARLVPLNLDEDAFAQLVGPPTWTYEFKAYRETLSKPIWDLLDRKGKFWRPHFGLLVLEALGQAAEPFLDLIVLSVELAHTGSLIVDDVEDQSEIRRGGPSIHRKFGVDVAVNAGNLLYFLPLLQIEHHPGLTTKQKLTLHAIATRHYVQAHLGQAADIYWSRHMDPQTLVEWLNGQTAGKILQAYAYKTGSAVVSACEWAASLAGVDEATRRVVIDFAVGLGVAFQIVDDVLNFSDSPDWRKIPGEDLTAGKLTYVIFQALRRLDGGARQDLMKLLTSAERRRDPDCLQEGVKLVRNSGALKACIEEAMIMFGQAWERFDRHLPPTWAKWTLYGLCLRLVNLAHDD